LQETGKWNLSILDTEHGKILSLKTDYLVPDKSILLLVGKISQLEEIACT